MENVPGNATKVMHILDQHGIGLGNDYDFGNGNGIDLPISYIKGFLDANGLKDANVDIDELALIIEDSYSEKGVLNHSAWGCEWTHRLTLREGYKSFKSIEPYAAAYRKGFAADDLDGSKAKKEKQEHKLKRFFHLLDRIGFGIDSARKLLKDELAD